MTKFTDEYIASLAADHKWKSKLLPKVKDKWLTALRSGSYAQARNTLRREILRNNQSCYAYCCLGVLADLTKERNGWKWINCGLVYGEDEEGHLLEESDTLPTPNPYLSHDDMIFLANANDGLGPFQDLNPVYGTLDQRRLSFSEIADIIERHL